MLTWQELRVLPEARLAKLDFAEVHLSFAVGLLGAEQLDIPRRVKSLNDIVGEVKRATCRLYSHFEQNTKAFENSKVFFRLVVLATVLQRDLGIPYNPSLINRGDFFHDAKNVFFFGVFNGHGGTCSSLPPLYVAVGRRLGYPMKLVKSKAHLFARWDDPDGERWNVECTSLGFNSYPDEHYRKWPFPCTDKEVNDFCLLRSLTPRQELAEFFAMRGHCWLDNQHYREAVEAYAWASELDPENHLHSGSLVAGMNRWHRTLRAKWPGADLIPIPYLNPYKPVPHRFQTIPENLERGILELERIEDILETHGEELQRRVVAEMKRREPPPRPVYEYNKDPEPPE